MMSFFPLGRHVGASTLLHGVSLGENLVRFWTSDSGVIGVVPSLEMLSLETQLGLRHCWSCGHGWQQPVVAILPCGKLDGCCRARVEAIAVMAAARGCCMVGFGCL
uniref:Uncharacterized protein n=1 Tax=Setaria italica TaxID=4555 RepID=K3Y083_SETIT